MPPSDHSNVVSCWPHRIGVLLTMIVFPLIWVGGLVTTYDAGMAVPDWPGTYGYNMFLYPIETWIYGPLDLFVEHGHRLLGTLSGMVAIALVVVTWKCDPRPSVRWFAVALLLLVIGQGALGGARVLMDDRVLAKIHGCVGPGFFAAVVAFCVITSGWWWRQSENRTDGQTAGRFSSMTTFAAMILSVSYFQLVIGAFLRHIQVTATPGEFRILTWLHIGTASAILLGTICQAIFSSFSQFRGRGIRPSINIFVVAGGSASGIGSRDLGL